MVIVMFVMVVMIHMTLIVMPFLTVPMPVMAVSMPITVAVSMVIVMAAMALMWMMGWTIIAIVLIATAIHKSDRQRIHIPSWHRLELLSDRCCSLFLRWLLV